MHQYSGVKKGYTYTAAQLPCVRRNPQRRPRSPNSRTGVREIVLDADGARASGSSVRIRRLFTSRGTDGGVVA